MTGNWASLTSQLVASRACGVTSAALRKALAAVGQNQFSVAKATSPRPPLNRVTSRQPSLQFQAEETKRLTYRTESSLSPGIGMHWPRAASRHFAQHCDVIRPGRNTDEQRTTITQSAGLTHNSLNGLQSSINKLLHYQSSSRKLILREVSEQSLEALFSLSHLCFYLKLLIEAHLKQRIKKWRVF